MRFLLTSLTFVGLMAPAIGDESLFDRLDRDADGTVTSSEVTEAQRPYFERALRVSDLNEDGKLTQAELAAALKDPEPVAVSSGLRGRNTGRSGLDIARLDRNKDGRISADEVPEQLRPRFQRALDQYGGNGIPIDTIRRMMRGQDNGTPKSSDKTTDTKKSSDTDAMSDDRRRLIKATERLDTNNDGKLTALELKRVPQIARLLDRNQDGEVSAAELRFLQTERPEIRPRDTPKASDDSNMQRQAGQRPTPENADVFFDRLDKNSDGKLTPNEVPQQLRRNFTRVDSNGDRSVSRSEFLQAVRRQAQSSDKR